MTREHVDQRHLVTYAEEQVNLSREHAFEYREQVRRLREKLDSYLSEHPTFELKKILISGSLAKGTALRTLNDIDLACYISGADTPKDTRALLEYLAMRLRAAFPNFKPDQVQLQTYSVTVSFRGSGLDVDVVPILYNGDVDWYGDLVSQDDGARLKTCIPRHLEFIRKRKQKHVTHFAQVARLLKQWAKQRKLESDQFRLKSFMIELILAHLSDGGQRFDDYPEAMQSFFTYVARTNLKQRIVFSDYYSASVVEAASDRVQIFDPVNAKNNVARLYTARQADALVAAALEAGDAIDAALYATTKSDTIRHWRRVFGPSFAA
jgi:tRNA nucleotidyltransferase (CCA-adding enzyme)